MHRLRGLKDRLSQRSKKPHNGKSQLSQTEMHADRPSVAPVSASTSASQTSVAQSQSEDSRSPKDLWQSAFDQLDQNEQDVLLQRNISTTSNKDDENHLRTTRLINEVIKLTKERYEEYQQGGIKIRRLTGEDIDLRKMSRKIIDAALSFKDIINAGVAFDPTGHAASAWAVVSLGLTMAKNHSDLQEAVFESSEYLADVLARCAYVEKNFYRSNSGESAMIEVATIGTYKAILQYAAEVLVGQNCGRGRRILGSLTSITSQRLKELQTSVKQEEQKLYQWVQLDQHLQHGEEAKSILAQLDEMSKSIQAIAQNFSLPIAEGAFWNSYMDQHETFCLDDTRTELRSQISEWAESSESKCIFWLNGMAGTGKSTIARTVAKSFNGKGQLGASFFFKKGEADRGNARRFIPTIVKQLILHNHQLASGVLRAIENDPDISAKAFQEQFKKLLLRPLQNLPPNQTSAMVIVIDALDECEKAEEITTILEHLPQIQQSTGMRLKIFLTSRPENPVLYGFQKNKAHQDLVLHEIPELVIEHDIALFLKDRFAKIRKSRDLPKDWPGDEKIETLVTMSVPLFISAATVCRFVEDEMFPPTVRLDELLKDQAKYVTKMDKTYLPILSRLLDDRDDEDTENLVQQFREIVGAIILLAVPLSANALSHLLGIQVDTTSNLLRSFRSILSIPGHQDLPVRILHLSFREFLLTTKARFYVNEEETHTKIASHCLLVMDKKLKHNICNLQSYGVQRMEIDSQAIEQCISVELKYSCRYWVYHLERSHVQVSEIEVLAFLKKHLLHWLEAMSLMGIISEAVGIIDRLQLGIKSNMGTELSRFLYDAKRFILKNIHMADNAPLQLYCSALIFLPMESIVRKVFEGERPRRILILSEAQRAWSAELQTLEGHSNWVQSVAFSPDSQMVASGSADGSLKLWDARTGTDLQTLDCHSGLVFSVNFSPDSQMVALGLSDGTVRLWDAKTGKEPQTLKGHSNSVESVAFSPTSQIVASGSYDRTIKLWDAKTGKELQTLEGHSNWVQSVAFSPDGQMVASGSADRTIKLWDAKTGKELQTLEAHSNPVQSVAFSPDSQMVASGSVDRTIKLWDAKTGKELRTLEGHLDWVRSVAFSPDSQMIASGSDDNTIKLWNAKTLEELQTLEGHLGWVQSVAFSPDSQMVASGSYDSTIKLWDAKTVEELQTLDGNLNSVQSVAFSPDSQMMALGSNDGIVKLWDAKTGKELRILEGHLGWVQSVAFSPDSQIVASGSNDDTIKLWDAKAGKELQTLEGHSNWVRSVAFSPDGQMVASGSDDSIVKLWDAKTGKELQTLDGHSHPVQTVAFSPDSQIVASGSDDSTIKLWDAKTGKELQTLEGHLQCSVRSVAFSPDGQILASGSTGSIVKLWDAKTGKELRILEGHLGWVQSVTFSPDGQTVASGSNDGTIKLWDAKTGKELQTLDDDSELVHSAAGQTPYKPNTQVSLADGWVTFGGQKLIRLPLEYRQFSCSATKDGTLALGYDDGRVFIVTFRTD